MNWLEVTSKGRKDLINLEKVQFIREQESGVAIIYFVGEDFSIPTEETYKEILATIERMFGRK